jgi:hypothetical protein
LISSFVNTLLEGLERQPLIILSALAFDIFQSNSNITITNYSSLLLNGAHLLISLLLFLQSTNISFAGTTTTYASNTLKIAIHIENWPFTTLNNSLVVTIDVSQMSPLVLSECNNGIQNKSDNKQNSLWWFAIQSSSYTLYGQMLSVGVLDGRNRALLFSHNSTTSKI